MGRKRLDPDKQGVNVTVRLEPAAMRDVERCRESLPVPVTTSAALRWLIGKGVKSVEKEAGNV